MADGILLSFIGADILFVLMGVIQLVFSLIVGNIRDKVPLSGVEAARNMLYQRFPLEAGIANAVLIFFTFLISVPAMILPARGWLKASGFMVVICSIFTLVLGLFLWLQTLNTKADLAPFWAMQTPELQDMMQSDFRCCGYFNYTTPAFVTDSTCPSPAAAALMRGCSVPLTTFANIFLDEVFTALFGMVGIDAILVLAIACLLKHRKEQARFRYLDEKAGYRSF